MKSSINQRLRNLCKSKEKSQADIAKAAEISPQRLNDILQERKPVSLHLIVPICKAIGCEPNDLFEWETENPGYLSNQYTKLMVIDINSGEELAVVTNDLITTARDDIVVKLTPTYD